MRIFSPPQELSSEAYDGLFGEKAVVGHDFLLAKARDINAAAAAAAADAEKVAQDSKKTKTERDLESLLDATTPKSPQQSRRLDAAPNPNPEEDSCRDDVTASSSSASNSAGEPDGGGRLNAEGDTSHTHPRGGNVLSNGEGSGSSILSDDEKGGARRTRWGELNPHFGFFRRVSRVP